MLVPVIAGSDKTTVSVASGHQDYHPVYVSPGNVSNAARRGHGIGVLPIAFLPIPKGTIPSHNPNIENANFELSSEQITTEGPCVSIVCTTTLPCLS